jgi:hypothetical protein
VREEGPPHDLSRRGSLVPDGFRSATTFPVLPERRVDLGLGFVNPLILEATTPTGVQSDHLGIGHAPVPHFPASRAGRILARAFLENPSVDMAVELVQIGRFGFARGTPHGRRRRWVVGR